MTKTTNRRPWNVNYPTSSDVKNYFLNQSEFKGINENQNVLLVDQESFTDTKNVYVNSNGLLRSRPSIKPENVFDNAISKMWSIDNYKIYLMVTDPGLSTLLIYDDYNTLVNEVHLETENPELVVADEAIFIFSNNEGYRFDLKNTNLTNIDDYIYIPKTKYFAGSEETVGESKNILTTAERYIYLYNNETPLPKSFFGKQVKFNIGDDKYDQIVTEDTLKVITEQKYDGIKTSLADYDTKKCLIAVSNNNTYAWYDRANNVLSYIVNGTIAQQWNFVLPPDAGSYEPKLNIIDDIQFDNTGAYIILHNTNYGGVGQTDRYENNSNKFYIVSCLADTSSGQMRYSELTEIKGLLFSNTALCWHFNDYNDFAFLSTGVDDNAYITFVKDGTEIHKSVTCIPTDGGSNGYLNTDAVSKGTYYDGTRFLALVEGYIGYDNLRGKGAFIYGATIYNNTIYDAARMTKYPKNNDVEYYTNEIINGSVKIFGSVGIVAQASYRGNYQSLLYEYNVVNFLINSVVIPPADTGEHANNFHFYVDDLDVPNSSAIVSVAISNDVSSILFPKGIYNIKDNIVTKLIAPKEGISDGIGTYPIGYTNYIHYKYGSVIYSSNCDITIEFEYNIDGENKLFIPSHNIELINFYFSHDNKLEISEVPDTDDGSFKWYFPEKNTQKFNYAITNLYPISANQIAIFFENEIWYSTFENDAYYYNKSRLNVGCKEGSEIVNTYDGTKIIFSCQRGLVAMTYQDFVATTEQTLSYLSDPIHNYYQSYSQTLIKLTVYDMWLIVYNGTNDALILDLRNLSWWKQSCEKYITQIVVDDRPLIVIGTATYRLNSGDDEYYDFIESKQVIDWFVESHRLHLNAPNYYKHIVNVTLLSVINDELNFSFKLDIRNYRKMINDGKTENSEFIVDNVRTFVKRLNYSKVNEFQYTLRRDDTNSIQIPLSLSSISIKYKVSGQVR